MQERTLLKIAMISSIMGILLLFLISNFNQFETSAILEDETNYLIQGEVKRVTELDKVTFLEISKEDDITVVLFKDYPVDFRKGEFIEVLGKSSKNERNEIQIIGKEVRIIK